MLVSLCRGPVNNLFYWLFPTDLRHGYKKDELIRFKNSAHCTVYLAVCILYYVFLWKFYIYLLIARGPRVFLQFFLL